MFPAFSVHTDSVTLSEVDYKMNTVVTGFLVIDGVVPAAVAPINPACTSSLLSVRDVVFVFPRVLRALGYADVGRCDIGFALAS